MAKSLLEQLPTIVAAGKRQAAQIPMIMNEATFRLFRPDLERPNRDDFEQAALAMNALPVAWVDSVDISNAVLFLASDEARYITGVTLPVDAGSLLK